MNFREAVIKSMKAYYKGQTPEKLSSLSPKKAKYTKKYFDKVSKDLGIETVDFDEYKRSKGR